jgi:hypothetical protein
MFQERDDVFGRIDFAMNTIYITNANNTGAVCAESHTAATFFHEIFHALDRFYCMNMIGSEHPKEALIDSLAQGMTQFLEDNFEPLISKKVRK